MKRKRKHYKVKQSFDSFEYLIYFHGKLTKKVNGDPFKRMSDCMQKTREKVLRAMYNSQNKFICARTEDGDLLVSSTPQSGQVGGIFRPT